jgi:hypothetical protein
MDNTTDDDLLIAKYLESIAGEGHLSFTNEEKPAIDRWIEQGWARSTSISNFVFTAEGVAHIHTLISRSGS